MAAVALISSNSACSTSPERHRRSGSTRSAQDPILLASHNVRPRQPQRVDRKTNQPVDYLFSHCGAPISEGYLNRVLIPLLTTKAGVPRADSRGPVTSHRARAMMASLYYNAPEGLSAADLQQWLGHRNVRSTQAYIKPSPRKLAKAVERATETARLVRGKIDPSALARGQPAVFYYLGQGSYCGNPAWHACPHRLACLKCPMFIGPDLARELEARDGIMDFTQQVPMTPEERAAVDGDIAALNRMLAAKESMPPPPVPNQRYIFNTRASWSPHGTPLAIRSASVQDDILPQIVVLSRRLVTLHHKLQECEQQGRSAVARGIRREVADAVDALHKAQVRLDGAATPGTLSPEAGAGPADQPAAHATLKPAPS